jgi:hypothetical protein
VSARKSSGSYRVRTEPSPPRGPGQHGSDTCVGYDAGQRGGQLARHRHFTHRETGLYPQRQPRPSAHHVRSHRSTARRTAHYDPGCHAIWQRTRPPEQHHAANRRNSLGCGNRGAWVRFGSEPAGGHHMAVRFCLEAARAFGSEKRRLYAREELDRLLALVGSIEHLQSRVRVSSG